MLSHHKTAIVACHFRLPIKRLHDFLRWNQKHAETCAIYIVSEKYRSLPVGETVEYQGDMPVYSPSIASNCGIRYAVDAGHEVVIKTDIDCIMQETFIDQASRLEPSDGIAPIYMRALSTRTDDLRAATPWTRGVGTMALRSSVWSALSGYDERMAGYGREDGDLYDRALDMGVSMHRPHAAVYHIEHDRDATDVGNGDLSGRRWGAGYPDWYPVMRAENIAVSQTGKWECAEWGLRGSA